MLTTDPTTAAKALLFSPAASPVLLHDGCSYIVQDASESVPMGFFPILTIEQADAYRPPHGKLPFFHEFGSWIEANAEEWWRSARLNASLVEA